ncbi:ABC transporter permease [Brevibacterium sp. 91QC2O2]|uniref:ABC transporter permease n=1 Tax=Brevibacterium sp. 91QC2O2 TaxID=2968458 RepID=UPI00359C8A86
MRSEPGAGGRGPAGVPLPRWLWVPAGLAALLVLLPLAGLLSRVDYTHFWSLVTSESALTALRLSLLTATVATLICLLLGVPLALVFARTRFPGRSVLRSLTLLPLVLPPVVGGIALLFTFGRMGLVGRQLEAVGIHIAFSTVAVILAQAFVALPFMVMTVEGALNSLDSRFELAALALGAKPGYVLRRVTLPVLGPALVSGTVLCFARALGEFGATVTFAGSLQGTTRTLPLEIYLTRETDSDAAVAMSMMLVVIAMVIVVGTYGWADHRRRGGTAGSGAVGGRASGGSARASGSGTSGASGKSGRGTGGEPVAAGAGEESGSAGAGLECDFDLPSRSLDVSFIVPAGVTCALIGPNGSGKSTTLDVLSGLVRPRAVRIRLGSELLTDVSAGRGVTAAPWKRLIVQLSQKPWLFPHLNVLDNAAFGLRARGLGKREARNRAFDLLDRVGAAELAGRRPMQLSGGQAQRVAIARALAVRPELVLLDEPLAALDTESQETIRVLLRELLAGTSTVLVTHDQRDLDLADRVLVMDAGRIVQDAPLQDFQAAPATEFAARFVTRTV